ncbi:hypothetical protein [Micromonospora sp. LOL_023]|uniref:hypothetical protein n=1 Tax=Micromonospora sp. LOL_023 TaxID=3345418 RepID=UPI003A877E1F
MDALDRVAGPALDLLARVDDQLTRHGAAAADPVWPLLRQVRALPGDAVAAFRAVRPAPLTAAGDAIRPHLDGYAEAADALAGRVDWSGAAAQAYDTVRAALATRLIGNGLTAGPGSLAGSLSATAGYAEALAAWVSSSRSALAVVLADALRSTEATTLVTAGVPGVAAEFSGVREAADAAAALAVPVLAVLLEIAERGEELLAQWRPRLAPAGAAGMAGVAPAPGTAGMRLDGVTRLRY